MLTATSQHLSDFGIAEGRGFLPATDPLDRLPAAFAPWERLARELPKLFAAGAVRRHLEKLPLLETAVLDNERELERAMMLLSYLGHAYVWADSKPANFIPECIAIPWHQVSQQLGRPPVLSYASYALNNWRRLDPAGPIALGNIALQQNFLGGIDEEWFVLVHVEIETRAAPAIASILPAQRPVMEYEPCALEPSLHSIAHASRQ